MGADSGVAAVLFGATSHQDGSPNNAVTGVKDCVAYDIVVANFGDWDALSGTDYYGVGGESNSVNTWVLDSVFHHMQGGGAGLSRSNAMSFQACARKGWMGRNVIHHVREYGIAVKMAHDAILSQNKIYRIRQSATTSIGAGIYIGNNDRCNQYGNQSGYDYSDNVWVNFNHIYDVQAGVSIEQKVSCSASSCCCPDCPPAVCPGNLSCCAPGSPGYWGPDYDGSRMYVVGNVFHHIQPFCPPPCTPPPPCPPACAPETKGQAVRIGPQAQVRVVNNTMDQCAQGVHILWTHNTGNPNECPPNGDPNNINRCIRDWVMR